MVCIHANVQAMSEIDVFYVLACANTFVRVYEQCLKGNICALGFNG